MKNNKRVKIRFKSVLVISLIILIALLLVFSGSKGKKKVTSDEEKLECELSSMIENIDGIKKAYVMLTFNTENEKESETSSLIDSFGSGKEKEEEKNKVNGVGVICTGGDRPTVKKDVSELVAAVLGISVNKVKVLPTGH